MKSATKSKAKPTPKAAASRPKAPTAALAGLEPRVEAGWSESRGAEHEIEEREAERLARQAAEELEEEEGVPGAGVVPEDEAEW
jgi:hypothetical protein